MRMRYFRFFSRSSISRVCVGTFLFVRVCVCVGASRIVVSLNYIYLYHLLREDKPQVFFSNAFWLLKNLETYCKWNPTTKTTTTITTTTLKKKLVLVNCDDSTWIWNKKYAMILESGTLQVVKYLPYLDKGNDSVLPQQPVYSLWMVYGLWIHVEVQYRILTGFISLSLLRRLLLSQYQPQSLYILFLLLHLTKRFPQHLSLHTYKSHHNKYLTNTTLVPCQGFGTTLSYACLRQ